MTSRKILFTATLVAALTLALAVASFSVTEDFGTGAAAGLVANLGWSSLEGDVQADGNWSAYPGWSGRSVNPATLTGSAGNYYYFEKSLGTVPLTGFWEFSADVYNLSDGIGVRSYSAGSTVGVGRYGAQMYAMLSVSPVGYDTNSWFFDARGFTGGSTDYTRFGANGFIGACNVSIWLDLDNKRTWATVTDSYGTTATSSIINFTNFAAFDAFNVLQDKRDAQYGMPVDNVSMVAVPEPGSMLALFTGLVGLSGYAIRRKK